MTFFQHSETKKRKSFSQVVKKLWRFNVRITLYLHCVYIYIYMLRKILKFLGEMSFDFEFAYLTLLKNRFLLKKLISYNSYSKSNRNFKICSFSKLTFRKKMNCNIWYFKMRNSFLRSSNMWIHTQLILPSNFSAILKTPRTFQLVLQRLNMNLTLSVLNFKLA